jgi:hypothetical protein
LNQNTNSLPRSRVAMDKLERAVNRLEGALGRPQADLFGHAERRPDFDGENHQDDFARLEETTRVVETRLDAVIERLRTILEE